MFKIKGKEILLYIICLFFPALVQGQIEDPVKWDFDINYVSENEVELVFKADIDPGWHLYSQHLPSDDGPVATSFHFTNHPYYERVGDVEETSEAVVGFEPVFDMDLRYFNDQAVFKQKVKVSEPYKTIEGFLEFMTCNDHKCLPPTEVDFSFKLAKEKLEALAAEDEEPKKGTGASGFSFGGSATETQPQNEILEPVEWQFEIGKINGNIAELVFTAEIDEGWHLYGQEIPKGGPIATTFHIEETDAFKTIDKVKNKTAPIEQYDPTFDMDLKYFEDRAVFTQKIKLYAPVNEINGYLEFMVCDDHRCLPPTEVEFDFNISDETLSTISFDEKPVSDAGEQPEEENKGLLGIFIAGFLGGLLALLTPCVFPMIPLTVSFFTKQDKGRGSGISKALIYGLSIIVIYVLLGFMVTKLLGADALNSMASSGFWNMLFFVIFIVFAASFFGAFELTIPNRWINKIDAQSDRGGLIGIFFMAFTLALVSFSCTGPIIGTLLVEAAIQGSNTGPLVGMFGFSFALALPFTVFAIFPSWLKSLPRSGGWLNSVKVVLGFLELALALKFLSNVDLAYHWGILTREVFIGLWITIFSLLGFYLLGKLKFAHDSDLPHISVPRLFFAIISFAFVAYLVPGMWGAPLKLISGFPPPLFYREWKAPSTTIQQLSDKDQIAGTHDCPHGLSCFHDIEKGMEYAREINKPLLVDFTGWTCVNCRKMEDNVWVENEVFQMLAEDYVLVSLYVDDKTRLPEAAQYVSDFSGKKIKTIGNKWSDYQATNFNANSQPFYVLMDNTGEVLIKPRGYTPDPEEYADFLRKGLEAYHNNNSITAENF